VRPAVGLVALLSGLLTLLAAIAPALAAEPTRRPQRHAPSTTHRVKPGDTLPKVAAQHHVTVAALVSANRLGGPDARLHTGQRLTIPIPSLGAAMARARRALPVARAARMMSPPRMLTLALPDFSALPPLFIWPLDGQLSSKFGRRRSGWHQGIDITAGRGTPVGAAAAGVVVGSTFEPRYGRVVRIEHLNGFTTIYAHNDENLVEAGDRVTLGQPIAAVGRTGRATACHVHFEIRQAGLAYNPLYMLPFPPVTALIDEASAANHDDDE
jgi:murein DD-endopeptidase MepM/ murein hydrolase activator NlpD